MIFGKAPGSPLWSAALIWLVLGVFFIALMTFFSVLIPSAAGAAGAGIGAYVLQAIAAIWKPLSNNSPAGLAGQATTLAAGTATPSSLWPVVTSLGLAAVFVWLATVLFRHKSFSRRRGCCAQTCTAEGLCKEANLELIVLDKNILRPADPTGH